LFYDSYGKPHLKDGKHISITHSFEYSGVIISDKPVGIDIEKQRPKIEIIAKKFVNYEFNYLNGNSPNYMRKLTVIWCVKESLYKLFATPACCLKSILWLFPLCLAMSRPWLGLTFKIKNTGI
jgi:4'-phosphopantetheinyl transferase